MKPLKDIEAEFKQKILPKMPVMFNNAVFRERISYYKQNERKPRLALHAQDANTGTATQPFYKPIAKPHVTVK